MPRVSKLQRDSLHLLTMAAPELERVKKQLRSVLISEKGGVAADRLERDYRDLVRTSHQLSSFGFLSMLFYGKDL